MPDVDSQGRLTFSFQPTPKLVLLQLEQAVASAVYYKDFRPYTKPFQAPITEADAKAYYRQLGTKDPSSLVENRGASHGLQGDDTPLLLVASAGAAGLLRL